LGGAGQTNNAALIQAAKVGDAGALRLALDGGANPDATDKVARPALWFAAQANSVGCMEVLVEAGANINKVDTVGVTPLIGAAWDGHTEAVEWLLARGADWRLETVAVVPETALDRAGNEQVKNQLAAKAAEEEAAAAEPEPADDDSALKELMAEIAAIGPAEPEPSPHGPHEKYLAIGFEKVIAAAKKIWGEGEQCEQCLNMSYNKIDDSAAGWTGTFCTIHTPNLRYAGGAYPPPAICLKCKTYVLNKNAPELREKPCVWVKA